jgi:hypothetical protein
MPLPPESWDYHYCITCGHEYYGNASMRHGKHIEHSLLSLYSPDYHTMYRPRWKLITGYLVTMRYGRSRNLAGPLTAENMYKEYRYRRLAAKRMPLNYIPI